MKDDRHISPEVLERFVSRTATSAERKEVVRHLLANCSRCQEYLKRCWPSPEPRPGLAEIGDPRYDRALDRAMERALSAVGLSSTSPHIPQQLLAELADHPATRQETMVRNHPRYWSLGLCEILIERSHEARFRDTHAMRHQARLALLIAEKLQPDSAGGTMVVEDCRARAWAAVANSLRVSGDLNHAEEAFATAQEHLERGSGDKATRARLLSQLASLRFDQRRFDSSLSLIGQVVKIWRDLRNPNELTRALIKQAMATGESGKPKAAVRLLLEAGKLVDSTTEPRLALIIAHNIVRFHVYGGEPEIALRLYVEARELYEQEQDPLIRVKALWQEGLIMSAGGHLEPAAEQLMAARAGLVSQGNRYEAALVSLDLAAVYAKLGRFAEMQALAGETLREMESRGVRREAIAALILLMRAATRDVALRLIRRAASALKASIAVRPMVEF